MTATTSPRPPTSPQKAPPSPPPPLAPTLSPPTSKPLPPPSPTPIPLTSPLRTYPKRLLPPLLSSTHPHGPLSGHPRSPTSQTRFDARVQEILRTMSVADIERRYEDVAGQVRGCYEEGERRREELEGERERLVMEREMERRVWGKLRGMR